MEKQDYTAIIVVKATANDAFEGIKRISAWWTENLEGHSEKLNDVCTVHFGETYVNLKIVEMIPDQKIVWLITDSYLHWLKDKNEWKYTRLIFEISGDKGATKIHFTHVGLVPAVECYNDCVKGWDQYVRNSLFRLLAEGKGRPEWKINTGSAIAE